MKRHLNDYVVSHLKKPDDKPYLYAWDHALPGFACRVGLNAKTFILKKSNRTITLGRYPVISLKDAREEARRRLAAKYLPHNTVYAETAIREYLEAISSDKRPATLAAYRQYLKRLPQEPLHDLNPQILYRALPEAKASANLCFATFKAFLSWCVERGYLDQNPLLKRRAPNKLKSRERLLSDAEVALIWRESFNHADFGQLIRCLCLSGQRLNQFQQFDPAWVHSDCIHFPSSVMKNKEPMTLPLTDLMREHLPSAPIRVSIAYFMRRFRDAVPIPHHTLHDHRRFVSSTMSKLKVPIDITEAILAHKTGSRTPIQRVYDRDTRLPQMREALDSYHAHLLQHVLTGTYRE